MSRLASLAIPGLQANQPVARFTAARLGGPADWLYVSPQKGGVDDLIQVAQAAWDEGVPVTVLGAGSNVLVSDKGIRGLVIINRLASVEFGEWHLGRTVSATSGTSLIQLARRCAEEGVAGMEWAIGVPGTVGGAVVNNAGAHGGDMAASVADVVIYEANRGPQLYSNEDLEYAYRSSALKRRSDRRFLVLLATFILPRDETEAIRATMAEYNAYRKRTQPPGASLGSIFKNPPGDYAGRLIEAAGLKGFSMGGVQVSPIHANFIVNSEEGTASDYYRVIREVQVRVAEQTGVHLELEVELLGEWGPSE